MARALAAVLAALPLAALAADASIQRVNPPGLAKPTGYTHGVVVTGGRTLYISGQVPLDKDGRLVAAGDFAGQTRQVFENLKAVLAGSGASFTDVVKLTVYVCDETKLAEYRKVRDQYITGAETPASTYVVVKALYKPDVMLEIDAIAITK